MTDEEKAELKKAVTETVDVLHEMGMRLYVQLHEDHMRIGKTYRRIMWLEYALIVWCSGWAIEGAVRGGIGWLFFTLNLALGMWSVRGLGKTRTLRASWREDHENLHGQMREYAEKMKAQKAQVRATPDDMR